MNLWKYRVLLTLSCALLFLIPSQVLGSDLPLDHWAYDYLDRLKVKGLLDGFLNQTRPISREEVARAIWRVTEAAKAGDTRITEVEQSQLEWLHMEFAEELKDHPLSARGQERHLFRWCDDQRGLILDAVGMSQGILGREHGSNCRILDLRASILARGFLGKELSYAVSVVKGQVNSNLDEVAKEDVGLTGYFDSRGSYAYYDWSHAHLNLRLPWLELQLGRQPISWGPGDRGNLALSSYPPAYDFLQIRATVLRVRYVYLHGFLLSEVMTERETPEGFIRREYPNKFVAAHRIELNPFPWVDLGLHEAVIYGERGLDLAYSNPLAWFWSAQHSSHDRDNVILGGDLRVRPIKGLSFYGALFIDELSLEDMFAQDARNKVAFQWGVYIVDPLGLENTDFRLEYARVQPCVYSHKFPVNNYRHDGVSLGHWLEENADDLYLALRHRCSRHLSIASHLTRTRQGERGEQPWCHLDPGRYSFLWGTVDRTLLMGLSLNVQPIHDLRISWSYERTERENRDHLPGEDETLDELSLSLSFDY